jgi:DNA-directed RNA polymerase subunit M/transcription elongation factor TFIIS
MHTSVILSEAMRYFTDNEHFELSVVLFAVAVERLMKQRLCELDDVLVLDKNNSVEHLVRFKKLQDKVKNIQSRQNLMTRKERRETFLTIPYNEVISRYEAMFNLNIEEDEAVTDKHELKRIREERDRRKAALVRLGNMRNNIVHYFEYYFNLVDEGLFILNEILPFIREMIQEVSDAYKYEDIFNETVFEKLKAKEEELTRQQSDTLSQKIREKKEEYSELNPELIEERKKINIRSSYDEREIVRDSMECPACGNASFCVLKLYTESEDDLSGQFLTVGRCFVCKLELSEDELKNTGML